MTRRNLLYQRRTQRFDVQPLAETAHRVLKGERFAVGVERDDFAVEDDLPRAERAGGFDNLGHGRSDVVQAPRIDGDALIAPMHLHARASLTDPEGDGRYVLQRIFKYSEIDSTR